MKAFWYNENRKNVCGLRIRELRKEKKMSCKDLEIKAGLSGYDFLTQNAITKVELGIRLFICNLLSCYIHMKILTHNQLRYWYDFISLIF